MYMYITVSQRTFSRIGCVVCTASCYRSSRLSLPGTRLRAGPLSFARLLAVRSALGGGHYKVASSYVLSIECTLRQCGILRKKTSRTLTDGHAHKSTTHQAPGSWCAVRGAGSARRPVSRVARPHCTHTCANNAPLIMEQNDETLHCRTRDVRSMCTLTLASLSGETQQHLGLSPGDQEKQRQLTESALAPKCGSVVPANRAHRKAPPAMLPLDWRL